jgi:hypothetical protein
LPLPAPVAAFYPPMKDLIDLLTLLDLLRFEVLWRPRFEETLEFVRWFDLDLPFLAT